MNKNITLHLNYNSKIALNLANEGEIKIKSLEHYPAGLGYIHKINVTTSNEKKSLEKVDVYYKDNLGQKFCAALLENNLYARVVGKNNAYMEKYAVKYSFKNPYDITFKSLKEMVQEGRNNFRFSRFVKIEKNNLIVRFVGHEVGGSYTPESKVVPIYIEKIQNKIQKKVIFLERESGGFGSDVYIFSISLKSSIKL